MTSWNRDVHVRVSHVKLKLGNTIHGPDNGDW